MGKSNFGWRNSTPLSWTANSVTHSTGEISSPGNGGSGMSLKIWRQGTYHIDNSSYTGSLDFQLPNTSTAYTNFYFRYYIKLPINFNPIDTYYLKMFRFNGSAGEFGNTNINDLFDYAGVGARGRSALQMYAFSESAWHDLLSIEDTTNLLWDGEWHCLQFHFDLVNHTMRFWFDGGVDGQPNKTVISNDFRGTWGSGEDMIQHLPLGNTQVVTWGSQWVSMEMDDVVIATTKAETDPIESGPDTTPPTRSAGSPSGALAAGTTSTTMSLTTNESATCKYGTTSAAYASLPNTFAGSGTTSHSATISGLTNGGSYTYYVRCQDDESTPNVNTDDYTISWTVSTPGVAGTLIWEEGFNDTSLVARSWEDDVTNVWVDSSQSQAGGNSFRHTWNNNAENVRNATNTANLVGVRKVIGNEEEIYVEWYWRLNSDYVGSEETYHPHLIYIIDSLWSNLSSGTLGVYLELTGRGLRAIVRQGEDAGGWHYSGYLLPLNQWVKLGAYMKMNTIGQTDGIMRLYADGTQVYSDTAVSYRTSSSVYFNTIAIAPWISTGVGGSPQEQTMWIDELKIYDGYTGGSIPPSGNGIRISTGATPVGAGSTPITPIQ